MFIRKEQRINQYKLFLCSLRIQLNYRRHVRSKFGEMRMEKQRLLKYMIPGLKLMYKLAQGNPENFKFRSINIISTFLGDKRWRHVLKLKTRRLYHRVLSIQKRFKQYRKKKV